MRRIFGLLCRFRGHRELFVPFPHEVVVDTDAGSRHVHGEVVCRLCRYRLFLEAA